MSLKGKAAAIGIGELRPSREAGDLTALDLMATVAAEAIADAGLEKNDIDGLLVGMASADPGMIYPSAVGELFGLRTKMLNVLDIGGASGAGMIWRAAAAIDAGTSTPAYSTVDAGVAPVVVDAAPLPVAVAAASRPTAAADAV